MTPAGRTSPPGRAERAALSRELSELLVELSIAVHRFAMYPTGHPSLAPAVEGVQDRLAEIFVERDSLSIGVAQRQLVIEGVATDARHPVLRDLARRLHHHQVGAVTFARGVEAPELEAVLLALAEDVERHGIPLGLRPSLPRWDHVRLFPVGYERLGLDAEGEGEAATTDRATQLWLGLAQAALAREEPLEEAPDTASLARSIASHDRDAAYDQVIVGYLHQLADELKGSGTAESEAVRRRLSSLVGELDDATLGRLVDMGGDAGLRRRFVLDANQTLAVDAVVKTLRAAASASHQDISTSMTRLLSKLAAHADRGAGRVRRQADAALRENVEELLDAWELQDPNPDAYTLVLDGMARAAPVFHGSAVEGEDALPGAQRLLQMAVEVDAWGPTVQKAIQELLDAGCPDVVLETVDGAPEGNALAERVLGFMTTPEQLRALLAGDDVDEGVLARLSDRMGEAAVEPLLDVLADSDSLAVRRKVFDRLTRMEPHVGRRAVQRLDDARWFVQRNMLALLHRLELLPPELDVSRFLGHGDPRVRREAFPLALRIPRARDRALAGALSDPDERMVRMALIHLQDGVPETLVPTLVGRVVKSGGRSGELRALGVRALRTSPSPLALEALLALAASGRSILGRPRLADTSPPMLAALRALAGTWRDDPRATQVLDAGIRSRDPRVQAAALGAEADA